MRSRLALALAAVLAASLLGAAGANAATEFGDNCVANQSTGGVPVNFFEFSAPGNPLPVAAPSAGVITQWKLNLVPEAAGFSIPQELRVLRVDTTAKTVQVVGQSAGSVTGGANTINTRLSVQTGDHLGIFGSSAEYGTLFCNTEPGNVIGVFEGNGGPYIEGSAPLRVPVAAILEPDADNDGYGDETQDKCPQSASTQAPCPVVVVDAYPMAKKSSIVVLVAVDETAPVSVAGTVKLPKGKKAKLKKVTKNVTAGKLVSFKLKLPGSVKAALKELASGKKLAVSLTATATNVAGLASTDKAKLKLKAQR